MQEGSYNVQFLSVYYHHNCLIIPKAPREGMESVRQARLGKVLWIYVLFKSYLPWSIKTINIFNTLSFMSN